MSKIAIAVAVVVIVVAAFAGYMFLYPSGISYTAPTTGSNTAGTDITTINSDSAISAAADAANSVSGTASDISAADNLSVPDVNGQ